MLHIRTLPGFGLKKKAMSYYKQYIVRHVGEYIKRDRCVVIVNRRDMEIFQGRRRRKKISLPGPDRKIYKVRAYDSRYDGWLADLCGYNRVQCNEFVLIGQMLGMYRYMNWTVGELDLRHKQIR